MNATVSGRASIFLMRANSDSWRSSEVSPSEKSMPRSVANRRISTETPFKELYIQPSAGDGGAALGAALVAWHCALGNTRRFVMEHAYWGEDHTVDDIQTALSMTGANGRLVEDEEKLLDLVVDRLVDGHVIGWSNGRCEWGPRALGNRSIIADPRNSQAKDVVNIKIKFRESIFGRSS